jgi:hypothetical protein
MRTVLALNNDQMGHGDEELGRKILGLLLNRGPVMKELTGIVFYNSGVKLIADGSPILPVLKQLHDGGVDLFPCGTCLAYYGLQPAIVGPSNMDEIIRELDRAEKVITL